MSAITTNNEVMATNNYFPAKSESVPMIYAYEDKYDPQLKGLLKVGYTTVGVQQRVRQQYNIVRPGEPPYRILVEESAMRQDGSTFMDHEVHRQLSKMGCWHVEGEWFRCTPQQVKAAIVAVRERKDSAWTRDKTFGMRPEQQAAVDKTAAYFDSNRREGGRVPHFLWNCKMRFGKTFTTYQLARRMGWRRVLVLTFKPAVAHAWEEDLLTHVDFEGWQFIARNSEATIDYQFHNADPEKPMVVFGSFQDFLGKNTANGGMKLKHEWAREFNWDCIVLDEYHYGAWRENAKELIGVSEDLGGEIENPDYFDEELIPITSKHYLYLSGTPFRAIASGEFIEEQIFNWTYSDEQREKEMWGDKPGNPYASLPKMVLLTYQLPAEITRVAEEGEFDEFDLNSFFEASVPGNDKSRVAEAVFKHHDEVQKWLDMLRGQYLPASVNDLKAGRPTLPLSYVKNRKPPLPFLNGDLYSNMNHTLWFLPNVASCFAMSNLLSEFQNTFFHDYRVVVCAGLQAGIGQQALPPVERAMSHPDPLHCKTITLTCGKLTTGVTVRPWTGIFMLRDTSSPETYFQAAFRVQSPWTITNSDGLHPNHTEIIKKVCYVFDFSPNRALRKVADYSCQLNVDEGNPEKCVDDFIRFLPVFCYESGVMNQLNAADVLDKAMTNTSATLLARRWESALLVNVDNFTLQRLMDNDDAMAALMKIEGFRSLNQDIETIINKTDAIKKKRKENEDGLTKKEKKALSDAEKEIKSKRRQIQEKLMKFATRIPIFMYLTDYREYSLKDVILQLEPMLFERVTGLTKHDFALLVSLNVFNEPLMNDAVYKFKRYEDSSLSYAGIDRHEGEQKVGGYDTVVTVDEYLSEK